MYELYIFSCSQVKKNENLPKSPSLPQNKSITALNETTHTVSSYDMTD